MTPFADILARAGPIPKLFNATMKEGQVTGILLIAEARLIPSSNGASFSP